MPFNFPAEVHVAPPAVPTFTTTPPNPSTVHVVPVRGQQGEQGIPGDSSEVLGYTYTTSNPAALHQIHHNLPFKPAGITCLDSDGALLLGWTPSHPAPGITEITFGGPVTPTIHLS